MTNDSPTELREVVEQLGQVVPDLPCEVLSADDGGSLIIIQSDSRELTVVLSPDGRRCYFVAEEEPDFNVTGIIIENQGVSDLGLWVAGNLDILPEGNLILPNK